MNILKNVVGISAVFLAFANSSFASSITAQDVVKNLIGHKAAYSFDLNERKSDSEVLGAEGIMSLRMDISCDTAATSQVLLLQYDMAEGDTMLYEESINSVENFLAKDFSFINKVKVNGNVSHDVKGSAKNMGDKGAIIERRNALDETKEFQSKKIVEFPVEQLAKILKSIKSGEERYSSRLFDGGNGAEKFYDVIVTSMGEAEYKDSFWPDGSNYSKPKKLHKIQFSYFDVQEGDVFEPESVLTVLMTDDGVAISLEIEFDSYSISGRLLSLETFGKPNCS